MTTTKWSWIGGIIILCFHTIAIAIEWLYETIERTTMITIVGIALTFERRT